MGIANFLSVCSTLVITAMMLLIVVDVVMRAFFNMPITGSVEITQMLMAGTILGFAKSCLGNDNLKVDVVMEHMPKTVQYVVDVITSVICIGICGLLCWRTIENALYSLDKGLSYLTLPQVPKWPFIILLAVGFAGGIVGFILRIKKLSDEHRAAPEQTEEGGAN